MRLRRTLGRLLNFSSHSRYIGWDRTDGLWLPSANRVFGTEDEDRDTCKGGIGFGRLN